MKILIPTFLLFATLVVAFAKECANKVLARVAEQLVRELRRWKVAVERTDDARRVVAESVLGVPTIKRRPPSRRFNSLRDCSCLGVRTQGCRGFRLAGPLGCRRAYPWCRRREPTNVGWAHNLLSFHARPASDTCVVGGINRNVLIVDESPICRTRVLLQRRYCPTLDNIVATTGNHLLCRD